MKICDLKYYKDNKGCYVLHSLHYVDNVEDERIFKVHYLINTSPDRVYFSYDYGYKTDKELDKEVVNLNKGNYGYTF